MRFLKHIEQNIAHLVSISPTFYEHLFRTQVFCAAFLCLQLRFVFFRRKEIGAKAARKMLVKLLIWTDLNLVRISFISVKLAFYISSQHKMFCPECFMDLDATLEANICAKIMFDSLFQKIEFFTQNVQGNICLTLR